MKIIEMLDKMAKGEITKNVEKKKLKKQEV